jgi:hypothetical protein
MVYTTLYLNLTELYHRSEWMTEIGKKGWTSLPAIVPPS